MTFLTNEPLDLGALLAAVHASDRGGLAMFVGRVRDHHDGRTVVGLSYSAYEPMAEAVCARIQAEAESRWPVRTALGHRIGELAIGDDAVAVVAGGSHRDEAFAACRYLIEELKRRVPIWKLERYADGSEAWVDPTREPEREAV
ncbi:MAG: molybdenum cofactor biosynthesis protein MoaE [Gemmatimonadales bacterium]